MSVSPADLVSLGCVPLLMVLASVCELRFGAAVAGIIASAPLTTAIGLAIVSSSLGTAAGRDMALHMGGYTAAQVGFALVVVFCVSRWGIVRAIGAGVAAFGTLVALAAVVPIAVAVSASVPALLVGRWLMPAASTPAAAPESVHTGPAMIAIRAGVASAATAALLVAATLFGPAVGGAVGAFPVFTITLCVFIFAAAGVPGLRATLQGLLRGLPGYVVFVLTYWAAAGYLGPVAGPMLAAGVCALVYVVVGRGRPRAAPPAGIAEVAAAPIAEGAHSR